MHKIPRDLNYADALTHYVSGPELMRHLERQGMTMREGRHELMPKVAEDQGKKEGDEEEEWGREEGDHEEQAKDEEQEDGNVGDPADAGFDVPVL